MTAVSEAQARCAEIVARLSSTRGDLLDPGMNVVPMRSRNGV